MMEKRILIVDDDACVRFVVRRALQDGDNTSLVFTASNGMEAMDVLAEVPFDLVITDLRMPRLNGIQLTEAVRSAHRSTTVIWMTAYGCHSVRTEAKRLGVEHCLDKPAEVGEIRAVVAAALGLTPSIGPDPVAEADE